MLIIILDNDIIICTCNLTLHCLVNCPTITGTVQSSCWCFIISFCLIIACCENLIYHGSIFALRRKLNDVTEYYFLHFHWGLRRILSLKNCGQNSLIFIGFEQRKNFNVTYRSRCSPCSIQPGCRSEQITPVSKCNAVFSSLVRYQLELFLNMRSFITHCSKFEPSHVLCRTDSYVIIQYY